MDSLDLAVDLKDPAFDDLAYRQQNFAHIQDLVEVFFLLQDSSVAYHEGQRRGLPIGVLNAPEDLFDDEHLRRPRVLPTCRRARLRRGAHAGRRIPLLDDVHRCAPTGCPARRALGRSARRGRGGVVTDPRPVDAALFADGATRLLSPVRVAGRARTVTFPQTGVVPAMRRRRRRGPSVARREGTIWAFTEQLFPPKPPYAVQGADFRPYFVGYVDLGDG